MALNSHMNTSLSKKNNVVTKKSCSSANHVHVVNKLVSRCRILCATRLECKPLTTQFSYMSCDSFQVKEQCEHWENASIFWLRKSCPVRAVAYDWSFKVRYESKLWKKKETQPYVFRDVSFQGGKLNMSNCRWKWLIKLHSVPWSK